MRGDFWFAKDQAEVNIQINPTAQPRTDVFIHGADHTPSKLKGTRAWNIYHMENSIDHPDVTTPLISDV